MKWIMLIGIGWAATGFKPECATQRWRNATSGAVLIWVIGVILMFALVMVSLVDLSRSATETLFAANAANRAQLIAQSGRMLADSWPCEDREDLPDSLITLPSGDTIAFSNFMITGGGTDPRAGATFRILATAHPGTAMESRAELFGVWEECNEGGGGPGVPASEYVVTSDQSFNSGAIYGDVAVLGEEFRAQGSGSGQFIEGDVYAAMGAVFSGGMVVRGDIFSGDDVRINEGFVSGDVHALGEFNMQGSSRVEGSVYASEDITISGSSRVLMDVHACNGDVELRASGMVEGNVYASGDVSLGGGTSVQGFVHAGGKITLAGSAQIMGDAIAGDTIKTTGGSSINGVECAFCNSPFPQPPICPVEFDFSALVPAPRTGFSAGGPDVAAGTHHLDPGSYGHVNVGGGALYLRGGSYFFSRLTLAWDGELYIDLSSAQEVRIFVEDNVSVRNLRVYISTTGQATDYQRAIDRANGVSLVDANLASLIYLETHGRYTSNGNASDWFGAIHTPDDDLSLGNGSVVIGSLFGRHKLNVNGVTIRFIPPKYFNP